MARSLPCSLLLLAIVLFVLAGCGGGSGGPSLTPVSGKVTVGGKVLTRGSVSFRPDKARGNNDPSEPFGDIGPDGVYKLYTGKNLGAPLGKYVVLVAATEEVDPNKPSDTPKSLVNLKYSDPDMPILQLDVVENPKPGHYDLDIPK
ncbi:MAG: hypothetical protein L0Y72_27675 [Gemmataceae bacterium]|nr:hypothetical protein [Gemmataceae bacterium]MCI0742827.1 hypothetical protein [Gemmataceae bacterium]